MDIRTDLAEVFKADGVRFNKSVGEGFGVGRQLTALIETVSIRSLQRCAEIVACEVTVFTVFTDVVDRKAAICFKSCLHGCILPFDFCFNGRTQFVRNIILIECVERLSQFILDRFGGLITEGVCQGAHTVCVQIQGNINVAHRRSPR